MLLTAPREVAMDTLLLCLFSNVACTSNPQPTQPTICNLEALDLTVGVAWLKLSGATHLRHDTLDGLACGQLLGDLQAPKST